MKHLEKLCLSCHFFRPKDSRVGICRVDKSMSPDYPKMDHGDHCEQWKTSGQQYYIRVGWVNRQKEMENG